MIGAKLRLPVDAPAEGFATDLFRPTRKKGTQLNPETAGGAPGPMAPGDTVRVPFVDLGPTHEQLTDGLLSEISELIDSGAFANGPQVARFERAFAGYCERRFCIGMSSGLDALRLSLLAHGIEPGDEVVVPANTFVATLEAVTQAGGVPVPVDASEDDYNADVDAVDAAMGKRTRVVVPVHLYGQMADLRRLGDLARRRGVEIVEDACQAHGAERDGLRAGTSSLAAAFSFYPAKNLGAWGDAGAAVTDDEELARRLRILREHGQGAKYEHELEGYTARLDTLQALVLLRKLPHLDRWNDERRSAAAFYAEALGDIDEVRLPPIPRGSRPVWHLYPVRTSHRARLAQFLSQRGIATGRHYPCAVHLSPAYAWLGYRRGAFPVAEALADELLSLPIFPGISQAQLEAVAGAVRAFFRDG